MRPRPTSMRQGCPLLLLAAALALVPALAAGAQQGGRSLSPRAQALLALNYSSWADDAAHGTSECQWNGITCGNGTLDISLGYTRIDGDGTLPAAWARVPGLRNISMPGQYRLHGTLPAAWSSMASLQWLDLGGCNLSGTLPPQWSDMAALQKLDLASNRLSGSLPPGWSKLRWLWHLDLGRNRLGGPLPHEWSSLYLLRHLNLSVNYLNNTLPPEWSKLVSLQQLDLSANLLSGALPPAWGSLAALERLNMSANKLAGVLPSQYARMLSLQSLDLSENALGGSLPASWPSGLSSICTLRLDLQRAGFTGLMPGSWRRWCLKGSMNVSLEGSRSLPSGLFTPRTPGGPGVPLAAWNATNALGHWPGLESDWRGNACVYPAVREYVTALLVLVPCIVVCMLAAACWLRCWLRRQATPSSAPSWRQRLGSSRRVRAALRTCKLLALAARPAIVLTDVVTDCLTIQQVWGSWVGVLLLAAVFLPEVLTTESLVITTAVAASQLGQQGAPAKPARPAAPPPGSGWRLRLGWLLALLKHPLRLTEHVLLRAYARSDSALWFAACVALSWPVLLVLTPLLVPFGAFDERIVQQLAPHEAGFITWRPTRAGKLWSWCAGAIEAPVSGGLLLMLLLLGVKPENGYVIEEPLSLYFTLTFSLIHILLFVWEMLWLWATSRSRAHWAARLRRPFVTAVAPASSQDKSVCTPVVAADECA